MSLEPKKCAKCPTPITWARARKTGKMMPVDAAPAENGNVRLTRDGDTWVADVLAGNGLDGARSAGESLHLNHFVTCPFSRDFRRPKAEARHG